MQERKSCNGEYFYRGVFDNEGKKRERWVARYMLFCEAENSDKGKNERKWETLERGKNKKRKE